MIKSETQTNMSPICFLAAERQQAVETRASAEHLDNSPAPGGQRSVGGRHFLQTRRLELEELVRHLRDMRRLHQRSGAA